MNLIFVIEKPENEGESYGIYVEDYPIFSIGDTEEEAIVNIKEAIDLFNSGDLIIGNDYTYTIKYHENN